MSLPLRTLIDDAENLALTLERTKKLQEEQRKLKKENFNFFSAIVSGKNEKGHIEKYHSNFIAYLLNPHSSHDFDNFFLHHFIEALKIEINVNQTEHIDENCKKTASLVCDRLLTAQNPQNIHVERERPTDNGRLIDISIESGREWIFFIENKIWSPEGNDQMKDYLTFAKKNFKQGIGVYLTLKGDWPQSIKGNDNSSICVINLSYHSILKWIKSCHTDSSLIDFPHIETALIQYNSVISKLLSIMTKETEDIIELLESNIHVASNIARNFSSLNNAMYLLVKKVRDLYIAQIDKTLSKKLEETPHPKGFKICLSQGSYLYSGDEYHCYGMGFYVQFDKSDYKYGGAGFGGAGNGVYVSGINAHYGDGIDKSNAVLIEAYESPSWDLLIQGSVGKIFDEIKTKVLNQYNNPSV